MYTIDTLPQDIKDDPSYIDAVEAGPITIVWPGRSLLGGPNEDLITIEYLCTMESSIHSINPPHQHELLYGPKVLHFHDDCRWCGKHQWFHTNITDHEYEASGETEYDKDRWELYAS